MCRELKGKDFFTQYHNDGLFGLSKSDSHVFKLSSDWFSPSNDDINRNKGHIKHLRELDDSEKNAYNILKLIACVRLAFSLKFTMFVVLGVVYRIKLTFCTLHAFAACEKLNPRA